MPVTIKTYLDVAVALVLAGLFVFAGWEYDQRKIDAAKMDKLSTAMEAQAAVLTQLQRGQDSSNQAITSMAAAQAQVTQHGGVVRQRVVTLHGSNDAIRKYLDTALPPGGCVLDDTCPAGSSAGPSVGSATPTVRQASDVAVADKR